MAFSANCKPLLLISLAADRSPFHLTRPDDDDEDEDEEDGDLAMVKVWLTEFYCFDYNNTTLESLSLSSTHLPHGNSMHLWRLNHQVSASPRVAEEKTRMYANKFPIKLIIKSMSDRLTCDLINFP